MATEKIYIQIDNDKIELTGQAKTDFLAEREIIKTEQALLETEQLAKQTARANAINKLATIAGLTEEEINAIL